ncbi:MAG: ATP-binding protein [Calothrix sp. FI2-JRJ7]|jgi:MoxR-like ATPase|nr:ATP-binding protein [Calothrix sp. FI2-JRJ7]
MNPVIALTRKQLTEFLLNVAVVRPVFIWGAPGIGKSYEVEEFARQVGIPCVSLLGSQLARLRFNRCTTNYRWNQSLLSAKDNC